MSTQLKEKLQADIKEAMKAKDASKLATLRLISAAIKQVEVDTREMLDDPKVVDILVKMKKQRLDSVDQYIKASRPDLADQENFEISIIDRYLPTPLSREEIIALIEQVKLEVEACGQADLGKVVAAIKPRVAGRAIMTEVVDLIKSLL